MKINLFDILVKSINLLQIIFQHEHYKFLACQLINYQIKKNLSNQISLFYQKYIQTQKLFIFIDSQYIMDSTNIRINPQQIWFFKPLDELMKKSIDYNDKQYFCLLFQRKNHIKNLLLEGKIDAKKYFALVMKIFKSNQQQKQYAQIQLTQLTQIFNKDIESWFNAQLQQTKILLKNQEVKYNEFKSKPSSLAQKAQQIAQKPRLFQQKIDQQQIIQKSVMRASKRMVQGTQSISLNINCIQFINFSLLDFFMQKYQQTSHKSTFIQLFQKKQKLLSGANNKDIAGGKYYLLAQKVHNDTKNPQVKKILKLDIDMLADLHQGNVQKWFNETVIDTKSKLEKQKQIYQKHKKGIIVNKMQVDMDLNLSNLTDQSTAQVDPKQCHSFTVMDKYMDKNEQNAQIYVTLYQKKKKILQLVQKRQLNAAKYQQILKKAVKQSIQNQKLKILYEMDLQNINDLHQGNMKEWFQTLIQQTKSNLMMQDDKYLQLKQQLKKTPKKVVKKQQPKPVQKAQIQTTTSQDFNLDITKIWSLKVLDNGMLMFGDNNEVFLKLFNQKKQILNLIKSNKIDSEKYKALQQKTMAYFQDNQQIKGQIEFDLMNIEGMHQGNLNQWMTEIIQTANFQLNEQQAKYEQIMKTQKKPSLINKKSSTQQKSKSKQPEIVLGYNVQKMYSLKVLDNTLLMHGDNDKVFLKVFAQKLKLVDLYKNGKLDAKKYKALQQKSLTQFADNEQIKGQIQFDLMEIDDMHGGDVETWFQDIVQSTSVQIGQQIARYQQLKQKKQSLDQSSSSKFEDQQKITKKSSQPSIQQPQSGQLLCFTVIKDGFSVFAKNKQFISTLNEKRDKFIQWVDTSKLGAEKYITMCTKIYGSTQNKWLKQKMQSQKLQLQVQYNNDQQKWFTNLIKLLKQKPKGQFDSAVSLAQNQINQGSAKSKIRYFLNEMAVYQSLAKYFKTNELNPSKNQLLKIYLTVPRKDLSEIIQKIKTDANFDVTSYCKKFLPPITQATFHQDLNYYQQKIAEYINLFNKQIQQLKQYGKKLKKSTNTKNFQKIKTKSDQCLQAIKYLNELIKTPGKLIPLPLLEQQIVQHPNMDEFTHLGATEVELTILSIQNLDGDCFVKICFQQNQLKQQHINNGPCKSTVRGKTNQNQMANIFKGDYKCFSVSIFKKGWFSNTELGKQYLENQFIRANIYQGKVKIAGVSITYEQRVKMCKRPTMTPIKQYKLKKYPAYEHSKQIQKQFIAKYTPSKK